MFDKITKFNFKPSEGDGRFRVYSKQFNELVDALRSVISDTGAFIGNVTGNVTGNSTGVHTGAVVLPQVTATILGDATNAINTADKVIGKLVFNTTDDLLYVASGIAATDDWVPSDGGTAITPS